MMNEQLPTGGEIPGAHIYEPYRRPDPDSLPADGEEFCSHCGESHEEGDLYRLGGDGDWMCVPCIVGTSDEWQRARRLMAQAAAILRLHKTAEAERVANELTLIVEGR